MASAGEPATNSGTDADGGASVTEGLATVYFPSEKGVFYNPPQIPNRDLSVLALRHFAQQWQREAAEKAEKQAAKAARWAAKQAAMAAEDGKKGAEADESAATPAAAEAPTPGEPARIRVLDALTASGLRALRYVKEVPEVASVVANDLSPDAVAALKNNIVRNGLTEEVIQPSIGDAVDVMHRSKPPDGVRFEAVELDPYGTAAPFLDGAMQCVAEGGLLMVTCTDLAVLCASYPEACHAKYGSYPLKAKSCHEGALRIVLACMEAHANRHRRYIVPLLSMHINFYVRLFVRVYTSPNEVKKSPTKLSHVYQCVGCDTFTTMPMARLISREGKEPKIVPAVGPPVGRECEHCGKVHHVGGPLWTAPMHDPAFIEELLESLQHGKGAELASAKRLIGMLTSVREELHDIPLFLQLNQMCNVLHVVVPKMVEVVSALMRQGYRVSRSHTDPAAIKTDAPHRALWDVLRCWAASQPARKKGLGETAPATAIMAIPPLVQADFKPLKAAQDLLAKKTEDGTKVGRFMPNPDEWGPGSRSTSHAAAFSAADADADAGASDAAPKAGRQGANPNSGMLEKRERNQGRRSRKRQAREEREWRGEGEEGEGEWGATTTGDAAAGKETS